MIIDTLDNLDIYTGLLAHQNGIFSLLNKKDELEGEGSFDGGYYRIVEVGNEPFANQYDANMDHIVVCIPVSQPALLLSSYRELSYGLQKQAGGWVQLLGSSVTTIVQAELDTFCLFMPGEPFSFACPAQGKEGTGRYLVLSMES